MARPSWIFPVTFVLTLLLSFSAFALVDAEESRPGVEVEVWGVHILTVRADFNEITLEQRADIIQRQINNIPYSSEYKVELVEGTEGQYKGAWVRVNNMRSFGFLSGDVPEGETIQSYGKQVMSHLQTWLDRRQSQMQPRILLFGVLYSVIATLLFAAGVYLVWRSHGFLLRKVQAVGIKVGVSQQEKLRGLNVVPLLLMMLSGLLRLLLLGLTALMVYLWLTFVLRQFPYTQGLGERLTDYIIDLVLTVGSGIFTAIPDLIMVGIIFWLTRLVVSGLKGVFLRVEKGRLQSDLFDAETAKATRRLIVILIWIFAAIIAYPYIPGSDTEAFKGVSVFLGLMVSLGSAGIVSQVLGGLIVVYSRAFQPGDFVKIAEHEGTITVVGVLSTKIKTLRNEEISVPNAVLLGATTVNYSKLSRNDGLVVMTTVTIGYDTPWRQVHGLLLSAAKRCEQISDTPEPFVVQTALSDWYVEYRLMVTIRDAAMKIRILSDLHQYIQDEFADAGVQIMSPHFVGQPEQPVLPMSGTTGTAPSS